MKSKFRSCVEELLVETKKAHTVWPNYSKYKTDNYDFYSNFNESKESKIREKVFAVNLYNDFVDFLLSKITPEQRDFINTTSCLNHTIPLDMDRESTVFENNFMVTASGNDLSEFGVEGKQTIYFKLTDQINDRASTTGEMINIKCNTVNGYIDVESIKNIVELPDMIIHEIIHVLDCYTSDDKVNSRPNVEYQNQTSEIHAYTHNIIRILEVLQNHGYKLDFSIFDSKDKFLGFLQKLYNHPDIRNIVSQHVVDVIYSFLDKVSQQNYNRMIQDVAEYFSTYDAIDKNGNPIEKSYKRGSINNISSTTISDKGK